MKVKTTFHSKPLIPLLLFCLLSTGCLQDHRKPKEKGKERPNIIFIMDDQHRLGKNQSICDYAYAGSLGQFGNLLPTSRLSSPHVYPQQKLYDVWTLPSSNWRLQKWRGHPRFPFTGKNHGSVF